jgi:hypothetical protein
MTVTAGAKARIRRDQGTERPSAAPEIARMMTPAVPPRSSKWNGSFWCRKIEPTV